MKTMTTALVALAVWVVREVAVLVYCTTSMTYNPDTVDAIRNGTGNTP